jgi:hypothetical protein
VCRICANFSPQPMVATRIEENMKASPIEDQVCS